MKRKSIKVRCLANLAGGLALLLALLLAWAGLAGYAGRPEPAQIEATAADPQVEIVVESQPQHS